MGCDMRGVSDDTIITANSQHQHLTLTLTGAAQFSSILTPFMMPLRVVVVVVVVVAIDEVSTSQGRDRFYRQGKISHHRQG